MTSAVITSPDAHFLAREAFLEEGGEAVFVDGGGGVGWVDWANMEENLYFRLHGLAAVSGCKSDRDDPSCPAGPDLRNT